MPDRNKPISLRKLVLEPFDFAVIDLDEPSALHTDKMVMMLPPEFRLVSGFFCADLDFICQSTFTEQTQIAMDGRISYFRVFSLYDIKEPFNSDVSVCRKEGVKDYISLLCIA